ncbi:50S ribosomal protein L11 methyltransferase [bacterium]|nr:50S ribosomal protein L11 methyltransferase [candidate division CSSED10-310 bacterium]
MDDSFEEVTITVPGCYAQEIEDALAGLGAAGTYRAVWPAAAGGRERIVAYFTTVEWRRRGAALSAALSLLTIPREGVWHSMEILPSSRTTPVEDLFPPLIVGARLLIASIPGLETPPRMTIVIKPGTGFGTGRHETTRLCLELLEEHPVGRGWFLDVGAGSGILSLAAARLGWTAGIALEIDPLAVENCAANLALNPDVTGIQIVTGGPDCVRGTFPLIMANLSPPVFQRYSRALVDRLAPGGMLIISGFTSVHRCLVLDGYSEFGLVPCAEKQAGDWHAVRLEKPV